jgi:hypothetical protein
MLLRQPLLAGAMHRSYLITIKGSRAFVFPKQANRARAVNLLFGSNFDSL